MSTNKELPESLLETPTQIVPLAIKHTPLDKAPKAGMIEAEIVDGGLSFAAMVMDISAYHVGNTCTRLIQRAKDGSAAPYKLVPVPGSKDEAPPHAQQGGNGGNSVPPQPDETDAERALLDAMPKSFTPEQRALMVKNGIIPQSAPDAIVEGYFKIAEMRKMNPWTKEIYLIERKRNFKLPNGQWSNGLTWIIVVGIDGARQRAHSTKQFCGIGDWCFDGVPEKQWIKEEVARARETNTKIGLPMFISVTAYRMVDGQKQGFEHTIKVGEFVNPKEESETKASSNPQHDKMPWVFAVKCASMAVLRSAFTDVLGGCYLEEEFQNGTMQGFTKAEIVPLTKEEVLAKIAEIEGMESRDERVKAGKLLSPHVNILNDEILSDHLRMAIVGIAVPMLNNARNEA